jgi:Zn-dependent oligopeptidase
MDLFERPGKMRGGWNIPFLSGRDLSGGGRTETAVAIIESFARPDRFTHRQVRSLLHELGHALHHSLGEARYARHSAFNVPMDFGVMKRLTLDYYGYSGEDGMEGAILHLVNGYAAAYYSYLWSLVFAQDVFSRFEGGGALDSRVWEEYRRKVLAPGAGRDPLLMLKDFLGRDPGEGSFLRGMGLG